MVKLRCLGERFVRANISSVECCDPSTPDLVWEIAFLLHPILI
jgi:hypothetical protein